MTPTFSPTLRALCAEATPGPWQSQHGWDRAGVAQIAAALEAAKNAHDALEALILQVDRRDNEITPVEMQARGARVALRDALAALDESDPTP